MACNVWVHERGCLVMKALGPEANFLGLDPAYSRIATSQVVILPVPYERTSSYGKGSLRGPQEIISASPQLEFYDEELEVEIFRLCKGIATAEPLQFEEEEAGAHAIERIYRAVSGLLEQGKFVVSLGGEHTCCLGPLRAYRERYGPDLTLLHMDAHADLRDQYLGDPFSHASVMARASEILSDIVQVGVRSHSLEETARLGQGAIRVFYAYLIQKGHMPDWQEQVIAQLRPNVYITIDCDFFDPSLIPAVGTPEPGGFHWYDTIAFLRQVAERRHVVGFDLCEFSPLEGLIHPNFTLARLVYKLIGYCFLTSRPSC
jgi:agmatinase